MAGFFHTIVSGRVTKDLELKYYDRADDPSTKKAGCYFDIAVQREYKEKDGSYKSDFVQIKTTGKIAENAASYVKKGMNIIVTGRPSVYSFETKDGRTISKISIAAKEITYGDIPKNDYNADTNDFNGTFREGFADAGTPFD